MNTQTAIASAIGFLLGFVVAKRVFEIGLKSYSKKGIFDIRDMK